jgi:hypothetical protein
LKTYSIKVALRGVTPMIWRRLQVDGTTSIADLHHIIQIAMGWDDDHLHCFHIYGEDYGLGRAGGMEFSHKASQVFIDDFTFDTGDRFTYTYNFTADWLCDIRVEAIDQKSKSVPHCFGGSGRQGESSYYKIDEAVALMNVVDKVLIAASKAKTLGDIHPLIEHYDSVRFSRRVINRQLKESFPGLT